MSSLVWPSPRLSVSSTKLRASNVPNQKPLLIHIHLPGVLVQPRENRSGAHPQKSRLMSTLIACPRLVAWLVVVISTLRVDLGLLIFM